MGFAEHFKPNAGSASEPYIDEVLKATTGFEEFAATYAGASFNDGLYRFHSSESGRQATRFVNEAFPDYAGRVHLFGFDWLGRQFGLDSKRSDAGEHLVLMMEPGTGEALEIPARFAEFHEQELTGNADAAVAVSFFEQWSAGNRDSVPLAHDQCVGYRVPLFLGGDDDVDNLEVSDIEVYWTLMGQLRSGAAELPEGSSVDQVKKS